MTSLIYKFKKKLDPFIQQEEIMLTHFVIFFLVEVNQEPKAIKSNIIFFHLKELIKNV